MSRIFPTLTATRLQAATYLFGIALFSISFLVFLNSSISFVVTDVIGQKENVGDAVGTLGFADELLALVACPLWGLLSDRIGVRTVAVVGYCVVGLSLILLVQSANVYPDLLLGRLGFSVGGAACSTMVTAVLPAMVAKRAPEQSAGEEERGSWRRDPSDADTARMQEEEREARRGSVAHSHTPSVSSELTITQTRYVSRSRTRVRSPSQGRHKDNAGSSGTGTSQLAGLVGLFTGAGALIALTLFLPLPAYFQEHDQTPAQSVQLSFYIVGGTAFVVALLLFIGLRHLPGEEHKSLRFLLRPSHPVTTTNTPAGTAPPTYLTLARSALALGTHDLDIALAYLGGFVARASSVAISLFIPLLVNAFYMRTGLCSSNPGTSLPDVKRDCARAYRNASALTGFAETAALLCAPLFGYLGGRAAKGRREWPLLGAAALGVVGYAMLGLLRDPRGPFGEEGMQGVLAVVAVGVSQIGAIVCSLGLLSRGVNETGPEKERPGTAGTLREHAIGDVETPSENAPLLNHVYEAGQAPELDRSQLKGSVAGIYSFAGGAGILLLTKAGGALFDSWTPGAPFFIMAVFNAVLMLAVLGVGSRRVVARFSGKGVRGEE